MTHSPRADGGLVLPYRDLWPTLHDSVFVAATATVIGDVAIGANSSLWFGAVVRGDVNEIRIGAGSNVQDGTIIHVTKGGRGTYIGDGVTVGHAAVLHACTLEDASFVGMGATLLDGVVVETGGMVAAGALVPPGKRVRAGELWAGSPAKAMRALKPAEAANIPETAARYAALAREYRGL